MVYFLISRFGVVVWLSSETFNFSSWDVGVPQPTLPRETSLAVGKCSFEIAPIPEEEQLLLLLISCVGEKMNVCYLGRFKVIRVVMGKQKGCNPNEYGRSIILCGRKGCCLCLIEGLM
jgi:hypothetical protein